VATFETLGVATDGLAEEEFLEGLVDMFCPPTAKRRKK